MNRTINSARASFFAIIKSIVNLLFPFVLRTILLKVIGDKYLGLNNLFHSLLMIMTAAKEGFDEALLYGFYEPISNNNDKDICALINLYKRIYIAIGLICIFVGLAAIPFLKFLINGDIPSNINIVYIYIVYLSEMIFQIMIFATESVLLRALQRGDIVYKIMSISNTFVYVIRILVLILYKNYYLYICFLPINVVLYRIIIKVYLNKRYKKYVGKGEPKKEKRQEIFAMSRDVFIQYLGQALSSSAASVVISYFLGLTAVAIYGNYYYIVYSITALSSMAINGITASLGNSIAKESKDKNYINFNKLNLINCWVMCWGTTCIFCLSQHFMEIWVGKKLMANNILVIFMSLYFYFSESRKVTTLFTSASGVWKKDRFMPIVSGIMNIVLCIFLVEYLGYSAPIASLLISCIIVEIPWETKVLFNEYFDMNERSYLIKVYFNVLATSLSVIICFIICKMIENINIINFIIKGIICIIVSSGIFYVFNRKDKNLKDLITTCIFLLSIRKDKNSD